MHPEALFAIEMNMVNSSVKVMTRVHICAIPNSKKSSTGNQFIGYRNFFGYSSFLKFFGSISGKQIRSDQRSDIPKAREELPQVETPTVLELSYQIHILCCEHPMSCGL
jgi:hypothetical protein